MEEAGVVVSDVYEALKEDIIFRRITGREKISERALARKFGVSVTPIREAIHRLEEEGLLIKEGKFRRVRNLSLDEIRHYYDVRLILEPEATSLAAANASERDIRYLAGLVEDMKRYADAKDFYRLDRVNKLFDETIYKMSGNPVLEEFLQKILLIIFPYRVMGTRLPFRLKETVKEHSAIFRAISLRRCIEARRIARRHIKSAADAVVAVMREFEEKGLNYY